MAKNNNLHDFLKDIADTIRNKKGTTDLINPQDFSSEFEAIQGGGYNVEQVILDDETCEIHITSADYKPLYNLTLQTSGSQVSIANDVSGQYSEGQEVFVSANFSGDGRFISFSGWYEGDTLLTTELSFIYIMPSRDVTLTAKTSTSSLA